MNIIASQFSGNGHPYRPNYNIRSQRPARVVLSDLIIIYVANDRQWSSFQTYKS